MRKRIKITSPRIVWVCLKSCWVSSNIHMLHKNIGNEEEPGGRSITELTKSVILPSLIPSPIPAIIAAKLKS